MTFVNLLIVILVGLAILAIGYILKKKWIKLLSIIPFAFAVWEVTRQSFV
ncbi:hypothetical protein ACJA3J_02495 [Halobacillus sp. SY10]